MSFKEKLYNFLMERENKSAILFLLYLFIMILITNLINNPFLGIFVLFFIYCLICKLYCRVVNLIFLGKFSLMEERKRPDFRRKSSEQSTKKDQG